MNYLNDYNNVDLSVDIGGLRLKNPVMNASGTFDPLLYKDFIDPTKLGAVVLKSITLNPREGNPPPRIHETPCGLLNSIGIPNEGAIEFVKNKIPILEKLKGVTFIASVAGFNPREFAEVVEILETAGEILKAYEINLSCPNLEKMGVNCALDEKCVKEAISRVVKVTNKPIIAKLAPDVTDIVSIARVAIENGANAVTIGNTYRAMAVDLKTRKPVFKNIVAGYSGPAIKPITLRAVFETASAGINVIASGGIFSVEDALEYLLVGAKAIQVGTANFVNPRIMVEIIEGIRNYLANNKIKNINDFIGKLELE
ncbi:dihydroorotate dehydrogenase [Thermogladius sp. 4427co]|uniref:dihydroorotate dehydrogenase n=1 Tax=Thermogladius sp. 4427co TaxID=3450718 RepID=UPI003F7A776F